MGVSDDIRDRLTASYTSITSLIPTPYNFTDEPNNNSFVINDGGSDMYDGGNYLNTNLTTPYSVVRTGGYGSRNTHIPYTHTKHVSASYAFKGTGTVATSTAFGSGSTYFTALYPALFVLVANNVSISEFSVTGNIGVDGGGSVTISDFTTTVGGSPYAVFRKSIYNGGDPSINHIFVIPGTGTGITHTWDTTRQYDDDAIQTLAGVSNFYYLLPCRASGALLSHSDASNIVTQFINVIGNISSSSSSGQTITSTSVASGESLSSATLGLNVLAGTTSGTESFGTASVNMSLAPASATAGQAFGVFSLTLNVTQTAIPSGESSGGHSVNMGLLSGWVTSQESVSVPTLQPSVAADSALTAESHGTHAIKMSVLAGTLSGGESIPSATVKLTVAAGSATSDESVGGLTLRPTLRIDAVPITSGEMFGDFDHEDAEYVCGQWVCDNVNNPSATCRGGAILPAVTVLTQRYYRQNPIPKHKRPRKGFYIRHGDH